MKNNSISLNGEWSAGYLSDAPYTQTVEPAVHFAAELPVPGYWEDMTELFQAAEFYKKLKVNPLYEDQSYPQTGYCADMFLPNPVGCIAYRKVITLEHIQKNTELYIGGAQNAVSAWINGVYLGHYEGYSTPFSFKVPEGVLVRGENRITLAVSNNRLTGYMGRPVSGLTSRAANECTGGIYGDVALCSYIDGLRDLWVTAAHNCESFTVETEGAQDVRKQVVVLDHNDPVCITEIPPGSTSVTLDAKNFLKWSPDHPELYEVRVRTENQELCRRFGIRRLTVKGTKIYLNGQPYYFRGVCEHCYQYATVHPTRDKNYYIGVIRKLKALGFNSIRFHTWIPPYEYMEAAEEEGMLLEVETPNNTSLAEWAQVVRFCRRYTSVNVYSTGNELQIDNDYEAHIRACAQLVHTQTDALFSPMSAMRGIEYMLTQEDPRVDTPFEHNPQRLSRIGDHCDLYNSYSLGFTSYDSSFGTQEILDKQNAVYGKPLLSHEICIQGTYIDLSLEQRYQGTRIGKTRFMSSVREHLADKGLLERAELYYENSVKWQSLLRKHCFETVRRCHTFAGYDFLGDIDTHWHTFGYCVGMMNEFYELKTGETAENVLRYNGPTVLLADIPRVNMQAGEDIQIPVWVSHYAADAENVILHICLSAEGKTIAERKLSVGQLKRGTLAELDRFRFRVPENGLPAQLTLTAELSGENALCSNRWKLYAFPRVEDRADHTAGKALICNGCSIEQLQAYMSQGKRVLIFGTEPFASSPATFQLSIAGRTNGHLATVIAKHPLTDKLPHEGFCGKQFENMLNGANAVILDGAPGVHNPIIDIAASYKNAKKEALLFEYRIGDGRLLVCGLKLAENDPAASWLKSRIIAYVNSDDFAPSACLTASELSRICASKEADGAADSNRAVNKNDITA